MNNQVNSKEEVYFKICNAVLKLEVTKGSKAWKISDIAREADVTRSLIYYYFGKEKETILKEAWGHMLSTIFNLSGEAPLGVRERMKVVVSQIKSMPYLFVLFFLEKNKDTEIGELIRSGEAKLLLKLKSIYESVSEEDIFKTYLLELGSVAYGNMTNEQIDKIFPE